MTLRDVVLTFAYSSTTSAGIALVFGLTQYKYLRIVFRYLLLLVFISFSADMTGIIISKSGIKSTWPISNTYHFLQYWILSIIYYHLIPKRNFRMVVVAMVLIFSVVYGFILSDSDKIIRLLSMPRTFSAATFIVYSIVYYYSIINAKELRSLKSNPEFYLNSTIFLFSSAIFVIYLVSEYLKSSPYEKYQTYLWMVHNSFGVLKNFMFCYIFYLNRKNLIGRKYANINFCYSWNCSYDSSF